jgi:hypothetical protein
MDFYTLSRICKSIGNEGSFWPGKESSPVANKSNYLADDFSFIKVLAVSHSY